LESLLPGRICKRPAILEILSVNGRPAAGSIPRDGSKPRSAKAALSWFAREKDVVPHGVALTPAWDCLRVQLTDPSTRYRLLPLMRFCSGVDVEPGAVDEAVVDRYMDHRARTTTRASDAASRRILVL
jgi:hypothetical protein